MVTRALLTSVVLSLTGLTAGCNTDLPHAVRSEEPIINLVLTPDSVEGTFETGLHALLATTATPAELEFRSADRFVMRRATDGALFDWREDPNPRGTNGSFFIGGNYVLAESAGPAGLGRRDLAAGETYTLEVSTFGRLITGRVTIPARPQPRLVERSDGHRVVEWRRVTAAGEYDLVVDTDFIREHTTIDTFYVLRDDAPRPEAHFRITAKDTNLVNYLRDAAVLRVGVQGAYGVFGAMSSAVIDLPPKNSARPAPKID
jgi:hypothetical protein